GCAESLRARGYGIYTARMDGELTVDDLHDLPQAALVFGNEHRGVSETMKSLAQGSFRVPMVGFVESLNISVAAAIAFHAATRARQGDLTLQKREELVARFLAASVSNADERIDEYVRRSWPGKHKSGF